MSARDASNGSAEVQHRFTPTAFLIMGGLLVWTADFVFVYVFAALACAKRFSDVQIAGMGIVPLVATLATLLSIAATVALVFYAAKRYNNTAASAHTRFIHFVVVATSAIAIVALIWLVLPPLVMEACEWGRE